MGKNFQDLFDRQKFEQELAEEISKDLKRQKTTPVNNR